MVLIGSVWERLSSIHKDSVSHGMEICGWRVVLTLFLWRILLMVLIGQVYQIRIRY